MVAVVSLLLVLTISCVVIRVASVALVHTGMENEAARFQARSAFTGAGFTTSEAEEVVRHPVRRRIVGLLMLGGNVGMVTAMSSLLLSFADIGRGEESWIPLAILAFGSVFLIAVFSSEFVDRHICRAISWAIGSFTQIGDPEPASFWQMQEDYGVAKLLVRAEEWLVGKTIKEAELNVQGVLVLGIERSGGEFLSAPEINVAIEGGDRLTLYGRRVQIEEIVRRACGGECEISRLEAADQQVASHFDRSEGRR